MNRKVAVTYGEQAKLEPYEAALRAAGLEPVRNPASLHGLHGLLLSGGADIDPALYGQHRDPRTQPPDAARDALEARLLRDALAEDLPVLAICRGLQLFNIVHGGTLDQHIEGHLVRTPDPSEDSHEVEVRPDTTLAALIGPGAKPVNSRHHQGVARVGEGLRVSAVSQDGVVEAVERPDKSFAVAVQWHAEDRRLTDAKDRRLFEAFAGAVERRAAEAR